MHSYQDGAVTECYCMNDTFYEQLEYTQNGVLLGYGIS